MADVRKLLQAERRLREASKPKPNSPSARVSTKRTHPEIDDSAATKRQKTTVNSSIRLLEGFFGERSERTTDGVLEAGDGNDGSLSRIEERRNVGVEEDDASMAEASNANANLSTLPSDFFEPKHTIPSTARAEVDEDEWAAFQADVAETVGVVTSSVMVIEAAPTTNNHAVAPEEQDSIDDYTKGEEEDAKQKLIDEFEEMEGLEQRVLRLKERREALKNKAPATRMEVAKIEPDDQKGEEDEEDEEDDDDFFRARGS